MKFMNAPVAVICMLLGIASLAQTQPYNLSDLQYLPGDALTGLSVNNQYEIAIAAGGPGYLAVWQDRRTVPGYVGISNLALQGNQTDIYGARLDSAGNLLDQSPIIISNAGLEQTKPAVAWNGQNWLVVWMTQRADWYFYSDLMGTRVSPNGTVLDDPPLPIRLQNANPANDYAQNPGVCSDGNNWIAYWRDQTWRDSYPYPNISAKRVSNGGIILDPQAVVLQQHAQMVFGPEMPQMAWAGDEFLLVWVQYQSSFDRILGRRFNASLQSIDSQPFVVTASNSTSTNPRIAANGTDFFVTIREKKGYRINHTGMVLDPSGIDLGGIYWSARYTDVTWDGSNWMTVFTDNNNNEPNTYHVRVSPVGTIIPPGLTLVAPIQDEQWDPAVASNGDQRSFAVWEQINSSQGVEENVHGASISAAGSAGPSQNVSVGLNRQMYVRFASNGDEHMAVFCSQGNGQSRILTQRINSLGQALDPEPTEHATSLEYNAFAPEIAGDGTQYLVIWVSDGAIKGRRLALDGTPIDPTPVTILTTTATSVAAAAIGNTFYVAYTYAFSFNQQRLRGVRVNGSNLSLIGSVTDLGAVYDKNPVVRTLGNQWLVAFEVQQSHDQLPSSVMGRLIDANGIVTSTLVVNAGGDADVPDVAIAGSRALIVWHDYTSLDAKIMGRLLDQNGSFVGTPFVVSDASNRQYFPTAAWDGQRFVAAWTDFRSNNGIEQLRGDIYAARISYDGVVADPNGIQLTSGPLPEDAPAVASFNGKTVIAFSKLNGLVTSEIQRIGYRILENTAGGGADITMIPVNPPIQIPARGGSFSFNVSIQNVSASQQTFDAWIMQILPNNTFQGPMIGPVSLTLAPSFTLQRTRNQNVPGSALPGTYTYIGYVGLYSAVKWDSSFFNYTKLSSGDGALVENWKNWGESFDPWTDHSETSLPTEFSVSGPYPNPFNPATRFSFTLPEAAHVTLKVFDLQGRLVATLLDGMQDAGSHEATFDASHLASGIYLYHLTAGKYKAGGKMVLVK